MKTQFSWFATFVAIAFLLSLGTAAAQSHGPDQRRGPAAQPPPQQMQKQQKADKQEQQAHEEQQRLREAEKARGDKDIAGNQMLSVEERNRFTERMQSAASEGEREQIREEYRNTILERTRAKQQGKDED